MSGNYRITFGWYGEDATDVDLELSLMTGSKLMSGLAPMHPGELLREDILPALGKLVANGPELWLNLQTKFDLRMAKKKLAKEIEKIPTLTAA